MAARRKFPWSVPDLVLLDEEFNEDVSDLVEAIKAGRTLQVDEAGGLNVRRGDFAGRPSGSGSELKP